MPPVVIQNHSVILPDCQKPPTQCLKWKSTNRIRVLTCTNGHGASETKAADYLCRADGYLIVNFKFLNHSQLHEHPEGCSYHGIHVEGEVIKMDIVYAKLWHEWDICCLELPKDNKKFFRHNSAFSLFFFLEWIFLKHTQRMHVSSGTNLEGEKYCQGER